VVPTFAFCNLSSLSQAFQHPERYGIKKDVHVCYWESEDGTNSFDVRLSRFERFCQVMNREGIRMNHAFADELPDHDRQLGNYYAYIRRYDLAVQHLERAVGRDPSDFITRRRLESYRSLLAVESDVPRSEPTILP
jgi:tetratricopeptide (TPR) repeat protein